MILAKELLEAPLLEALFKISNRPTPDDALHALYDTKVQDVALGVAQRMRTLAMEEDEHNAKKKLSLINYRRFYVGGVGIGVVLGRRSSVPYEWWAFAACNTKSDRKAPKFCAEMRILRAAREVRCSCIGGLVVLGENQSDGKSGKLRKTLDPCGDCRDCMRDAANVPRLRRNTLIVTSQPLGQIRYAERLRDMMAAHKETWP